MIIGIMGKIGAGKTTLGNILMSNHGFVEYSFAMPLKKIALVLGFTQSQVYGTQAQKLEVNKQWGVSGREFMQTFGTEVCKGFLPTVLPTFNDIWVQQFKHYYANNKHVNIVIPDVRFQDEAQAIREIGGILVNIHRHKNPLEMNVDEIANYHIKLGDEKKQSHRAHASETSMSGVQPNHTIWNDSNDLKLLEKDIWDIVNGHNTHGRDLSSIGTQLI